MQNPTWYNNQVHGCCNIAVQSCYFIIPWQHVLSCMNNAVDLSWWFQRCSSLFVHPWIVCSNMHEQDCQQHYSSWPAQPRLSLSTGKGKMCVFTCVKTPDQRWTRSLRGNSILKQIWHRDLISSDLFLNKWVGISKIREIFICTILNVDWSSTLSEPKKPTSQDKLNSAKKSVLNFLFLILYSNEDPQLETPVIRSVLCIHPFYISYSLFTLLTHATPRKGDSRFLEVGGRGNVSWFSMALNVGALESDPVETWLKRYQQHWWLRPCDSWGVLKCHFLQFDTKIF